MKTTIFYTVTFLAFLLTNSSMAMSKFILSFNCCSTDSVATFLNRKVRSQVILYQFSFQKTPLTGSNTNGDCEENPQHYYIWNRTPKVILLNELQKFKGAFFFYCELCIAHIVQLWCNNNVLLNCTTMNNKRRNSYQFSFSAINCTQPPVQLTDLLVIWMQHGDLKIFIKTHQHTEARNHFP